MKHIGIDARFMLRPQRGIPLYVTRLCQYLPAINRDYQYHLFINKGYEHNDAPENYQPRLDGISARNPNVEFHNHDDDAEIRWEQIHLPRLAREFKIDLLHMPGNRNCFFAGVPTVVTVHDVIEIVFMKMDFVQRMSLSKTNLKMCLYIIRQQLYIWATYRFALGKASRIVTVSDFSAGEIHHHLKIASERISVIHHGLDEEFILPAAMDRFDRGNRKNVLMLGGDAIQKNAHGALAAWAKVPSVIRSRFPLKIIGFCGNQQSPLLKALHGYGLNDEVEIVGWVSQEDLIRDLRDAVLFLYVSRYEGFGFPPLHAMASGTPLVCSNVTSIPEVIGPVGLQYAPDDHDGIAFGIESLLTDEQIWIDQAKAGIGRANDFSWELSAQKHLQVFQDILR